MQLECWPCTNLITYCILFALSPFYVNHSQSFQHCANMPGPVHQMHCIYRVMYRNTFNTSIAFFHTIYRCTKFQLDGMHFLCWVYIMVTAVQSNKWIWPIFTNVSTQQLLFLLSSSVFFLFDGKKNSWIYFWKLGFRKSLYHKLWSELREKKLHVELELVTLTQLIDPIEYGHESFFSWFHSESLSNRMLLIHNVWHHSKCNAIT